MRKCATIHISADAVFHLYVLVFSIFAGRFSLSAHGVIFIEVGSPFDSPPGCDQLSLHMGILRTFITSRSNRRAHPPFSEFAPHSSFFPPSSDRRRPGQLEAADDWPADWPEDIHRGMGLYDRGRGGRRRISPAPSDSPPSYGG